MARPRTVQRTSRRGGRLSEWIGVADQAFSNVASGGATLISSFTPLETLTVIRNRGVISIQPQAVTADLDIVGAFGMGIVSVEAFNAGVASMPEPFSDAQWSGWMVWQAFAFRFELLDTTGANFVPWTMELDSKAMRKMGPHEVLIAIAESQVGAYSIAAPMRTLVKLS